MGLLLGLRGDRVSSIRIRSGSMKTGLIVLWYLVILLLAFLAGTTGAIVIALIAQVAGLVAFTRLFRARDESDASRPWWKLTGGPTSSFVVGILFLAQAGSSAVTLTRLGPVIAIYAATQLVIAVAFLASGGMLLRAAPSSSMNKSGARRST